MLKKKSAFRITAFMISLLMLVATAVSCGGNKQPPDTTVPNQSDDIGGTTVTDVPDEKDIETLEEKFGKKDYDDTTLLYLTGGDNNWWVNYDIVGPEESGEIMSEAIFKRNTEIEDTYKVIITHEQLTHAEALNAVKKDVNSGDNLYDSYFCNGSNIPKIISGGLAYNLNDIEGFDFNDPWWTKNVCDMLNFGNEYRFFAVGDMNVMAWKTAACMMYNYSLGEREGVEDCFELVRQGKWTMDKWNQLIKDFAVDYDDDGMDYDKDRFGLVCGAQTFDYSINAMGLTFTAVDDDNWPTLFTMSEKMVNALEKLITTYSINNTINVHNTAHSRGESLAGKSVILFAEGRFLFFSDTIGASFQLWDMEDDYGFLPFPKYDEAQEDYVASIQYAQMSLVTIPTRAEARLDATVDVINAMGFINQRDLKTVFFDAVFGTRSVRDQNSMEMLEIILQERTFDLGISLNFGSVISRVRSQVHNASGAFASQYESLKKAGELDCKKFVNSIKPN